MGRWAVGCCRFTCPSGSGASGSCQMVPGIDLSQHRYSTMLKLRDPKNRHGAVWLVEPGVTVGRRAGNHLVINRPDVADCQFEIRVKGEQFVLRNRAPDYPQIGRASCRERV